MTAAGCASPPAPSTPAERTPRPESITRDNPGGDAQSPVDAALTRLLEEPLGRKIDKFKTIQPVFSDVKNWKRIRFFGYPTRAGFRYGKDPNYAAAVLLYWEADDDAPTSCIETVAVKAERVGQAFDLEFGPLEREMRDHRRGVEAVDWPAHEAAWQEKEQARIEKLRAQLARAEERRERLRQRRAERQAQRERAQRDKARQDQAPVPSGDEAASPQPPKDSAPKPPLPKGPAPKESGGAEPAPDAPTEQGQKTEPSAQADMARVARFARMRRQLAAAAQQRRTRTPEQVAAAEKARQERIERMLQVRPTPRPHYKTLGRGDMPIVAGSGSFATLFNRNHYLGALVAYESWPGTCLVQGFAVRVGSDEMLAHQVLERWLDEMAPILQWHLDLREQPEIKNR